MRYRRLGPADFFLTIQTEEEARHWLWRSRFGGRDFLCAWCQHEAFYPIRSRPEVRKCAACRRHIRLRAGTILQNSKLPVLSWLRSIFLMMQSKTGVSALQVKRQLRFKSYGSTWSMLQKIRHALGLRDQLYKLKDVIELDGADFRRQASHEAADVLVAIESKDWIDERGRHKSRAGFVKVLVGSPSSYNVQTILKEGIQTGAIVRTDGHKTFSMVDAPFVDINPKVTHGQKVVLDSWLPWVHKFISNSKSWIHGTHHGIRAKYLPRYLAEYAYRFNRRHDPDSLFHRAAVACALATPITLGALCG
jgi:hypothetical protein